MATHIEVRGLEEFQKHMLAKSAAFAPVLREAMQKSVIHVHENLPPYPEPASESYRRTGLLGRSITTEVKPLGKLIVGTIGTTTVYAPWVISSEKTPDGRGGQVSWHQGRWYTLQERVVLARDKIREFFSDGVAKALGAK